jgi:hypothetical protein
MQNRRKASGILLAVVFLAFLVSGPAPCAPAAFEGEAASKAINAFGMVTSQ